MEDKSKSFYQKIWEILPGFIQNLLYFFFYWIWDRLWTFFRIKKILINPFGRAIISSLAVIVGMLASIKSHEINNSFPFALGPYGSINWWAFSFWVSLFLFFIFFYKAQAYSDESTKLKQNKLIRTIETMPPADFFSLYELFFNEHILGVYRLAKRAKGKAGEDRTVAIKIFESAIRVILDGYVSLAHQWDRPDSTYDKTMVYRVNIMLYHPIPKSDVSEFRSSISKALPEHNQFFVVDNIEAIFASFDGILALEDNKLTTTTKNYGSIPDNDIKPLFFPITFEGVGGKIIQNLPGAPIAVRRGVKMS